MKSNSLSHTQFWIVETGVREAQKVIEDAVREAEEYLKILNKAIAIWDWANKQLDKYRKMPWLE